MPELWPQWQGGLTPETNATLTDFASTSLARAVEIPVPQTDALAGRFPLIASPSPLVEDERAAVLRNLHFGNAFIDHTIHAHQRQGERWDDCGVISCGSLSLSLAAAVPHYDQGIFEGVRAYRYKDGSVWIFCPRYNAVRLNASARRMAPPELAEEDFVTSLVDLAHADVAWVPSGEGESLYLRPFAFASGAFLGVHPATVVDYYAIISPTGSYSPHDLEPVSIWVATEYRRVGCGGTGVARTGGNYISSLLPQQEAYAQGRDQVCLLDDASQKNIGELGGMNLVVVDADETVHTPRLTGTALEGCTRSATIHLPRGSGRNVVEETISPQELLADIELGRVSKVFAYETAVVIIPLGHLKGEGFDARTEGNKVTRQIHDRLTAIQTGRAEDPYGWIYQLMSPRL